MSNQSEDDAKKLFKVLVFILLISSKNTSLLSVFLLRLSYERSGVFT